MANRKHSKIDNLPDDLKGAVEQMLLSGSTYSEIVDFLKENEQSISVAAVCRYARAYNANVEQLRMTNENFKNIMRELNNYPDLDTTEAIIRIVSGNVFNRLANTEEEDWNEVKPVSYTHLDVYKRQEVDYGKGISNRRTDRCREDKLKHSAG